MIRAYAVIGAVLVLAALIVCAYGIGRADGRAVQAAEYADEQDEQRKLAEIERAHAAQVVEAIRQTREQAQQGAADAIAGIQITHQTIKQRVEREIVRLPSGDDCRIPDSILQLVNAALAGDRAAAADAVRAADDGVPADAPAGG